MNLPRLRPVNRIKPSRYIVIGDTFRTHKDALELFGEENKNRAIRRSTCFFGNKKVVWFPKIAVEDNARRLVPPANIKWRNTLSSDYTELNQKWVSDDPPKPFTNKFNDLSLEFAVFAKLPPEKNKENVYTFLGIYRKQAHQDLYYSEVYQQKAKELYIDEWKEAQEAQKGEDTEEDEDEDEE